MGLERVWGDWVAETDKQIYVQKCKRTESDLWEVVLFHVDGVVREGIFAKECH